MITFELGIFFPKFLEEKLELVRNLGLGAKPGLWKCIRSSLQLFRKRRKHLNLLNISGAFAA